jgi:repressor LexA
MERTMEAIGPKLRRQRRRLGLTLDDLAGRTGISKPYLSLIETGRVPNPPSDEKLRRLEQSLGFPANELISQAHLHRTPSDVRAMLASLLSKQDQTNGKTAASPPPNGKPIQQPLRDPQSVNLDEAYLSGVLQQLVDRSTSNVEPIATLQVPVINKVSAGYPRDFTDMSYPPRVADDYVSCPDVRDQDAFAARVHGDSMFPKYRQGDIVIFSPAATPNSGDDCFVRFGDGNTTFKRVFFEGDDPDNPILRLQPRNEKYPPQTVPSDKITGLYKALYKYMRIDEE